MNSMNGRIRATAETQLQVAIGVLLESLADKNVSVCEAVTNSLLKISEKYPSQVLLSCSSFSLSIFKSSHDHRATVLSLMSKICNEPLFNIDGDTAIKIIEFSIKVMSENTLHEPIIQMPASDILVALGRKHYIQVKTKTLWNVLRSLFQQEQQE